MSKLTGWQRQRNLTGRLFLPIHSRQNVCDVDIDQQDARLQERLAAAECLSEVRGEELIQRVIAQYVVAYEAEPVSIVKWADEDGDLHTGEPDGRKRVTRGQGGRELVASEEFDRQQRIILTAAQRVAVAIQRGELTRASTCEQCGSGGRIEAAHKNYVDQLDVRWLCRSCHRRWDKAEPKSRVA